MSKEETPPQKPLTPEQQYKQIFSQLSAQFKNPIRNIMSEAEETVQNTITTLIQQLLQINNALKNSNEEIVKLQKLLGENKIDFSPTLPNRAERRAQERKQSKMDKKNQ